MTNEERAERVEKKSSLSKYAIVVLCVVLLGAGAFWLSTSEPLVDALGRPDTDRSGSSAPTIADVPASAAPKPGKSLTNSIGMEFVRIEAGEFIMGSPADEEARERHERQHRVKLAKGFHMGVYEVTQAQWQTVMGNNPSHFKGDNLPVEQVSWDDAMAFCQKLSEREGKKYRLPTEAEWECACRAGTTTPFNTGQTIGPDQANYDGEFTYGKGVKGINRKATTAGGSFQPNPWGLYDMHGNVWEWCQDKYGGAKAFRVLRGGSWYDPPKYCRSASRCRFAPVYRFALIGFRVAMDLPD